jgi:hypothetical protein
MFRIVTAFVENPMLLLICDDRRCGCFATKALPATASEPDRSAAIEPFIGELMAQGWILGLDQHLCPQHVKRITEGRRLVEVPQVRLH